MDALSNGQQSAEASDYFVVRLSRLLTHPARLAGVVERLGTGEKRSFDGGEHLLWLMTAWPVRLSAGPTSHRDQRGCAPRARKETA